LASNLGSGSGHFLFCVLSERVLEIHGVVYKTASMTQHPKRPRDRAQLAKLMIDIASGEVEELVGARGHSRPSAAPVAQRQDFHAAAAIELDRAQESRIRVSNQ
jgi:hypothetical protein